MFRAFAQISASAAREGVPSFLSLMAVRVPAMLLVVLATVCLHTEAARLVPSRHDADDVVDLDRLNEGYVLKNGSLLKPFEGLELEGLPKSGFKATMGRSSA